MLSLPTVLLALATVLPYVQAHAGPAPVNWKRDNFEARHSLQKRCGASLEDRKRKRDLEADASVNLKRRELNLPQRRSFRVNGRDVAQRQSNDSTVLFQPGKVTPETTQGPYHILDEIVRQNITENQPGVPLELNIEFFDIASCRPVQVWVDGWSCNATGNYAGYANLTGGGGGGFPGGGPGGIPSGFPGGSPSSSSAPSASTSLGPYDGSDDPAAGDFLNTVPTDSFTFLRGIWQTTTEGKLKVFSIVPGWYTGRAVHFHVKAYPFGHIAENGTFVADGSAVHTGQIFFENEFMEQVAQQPEYLQNVMAWENSTKPETDQWYPYQSATGYNAYADIQYVDDSDISKGVVGSIAIGLNLTFSSPELSTQYASFDVEAYRASSLLPAYGGHTTPAGPGPAPTH